MNTTTPSLRGTNPDEFEMDASHYDERVRLRVAQQPGLDDYLIRLLALGGTAAIHAALLERDDLTAEQRALIEDLSPVAAPEPLATNDVDEPNHEDEPADAYEEHTEPWAFNEPVAVVEDSKSRHSEFVLLA